MRTNIPYVLLRRAFRAHGMNQDDVAAHIERSRQYVSARMNGQGTFLIGEAYAIMLAIGKPVNELHRYFPEDPYELIDEMKKQPTGRLFRLVEEPDLAL